MTVLVVDTDRRRQIPSEFYLGHTGTREEGEKLLCIDRAGGDDQWLKKT